MISRKLELYNSADLLIEKVIQNLDLVQITLDEVINLDELYNKAFERETGSNHNMEKRILKVIMTRLPPPVAMQSFLNFKSRLNKIIKLYIFLKQKVIVEYLYYIKTIYSKHQILIKLTRHNENIVFIVPNIDLNISLKLKDTLIKNHRDLLRQIRPQKFSQL
ncbi:hypothetical protein GGQ84_002076 [Desulfitispora alkaliphila]|uniref:hypothetical protein n=1 Tax=Desulfitispora alkaliphila TaxID=622674 RepID=UPI003D1FF6C5